jgi:hypothetical protein
VIIGDKAVGQTALLVGRQVADRPAGSHSPADLVTFLKTFEIAYHS